MLVRIIVIVIIVIVDCLPGLEVLPPFGLCSRALQEFLAGVCHFGFATLFLAVQDAAIMSPHE